MESAKPLLDDTSKDGIREITSHGGKAENDNSPKGVDPKAITQGGELPQYENGTFVMQSSSEFLL